MGQATLNHAVRKTSALGPSVRNLLRHYQLEPSKIHSSGPHQILLKSDVLNYVGQNNLQPVNNYDSQPKQETPQKYSSPLGSSGFQPQPGPEGFSRIAKELLNM